jgi:hypothetical protein
MAKTIQLKLQRTFRKPRIKDVNIAFSTLCIIIFTLPGYFLRHTYLISGNWALNGTDSIRTSVGITNNPFTFEEN